MSVSSLVYPGGDFLIVPRIPAAKARSAVVARRSARKAALQAVTGAAATPTQGKIRLDIAGATPATVMAITPTAREGLTITTYHLGRENGNGNRRSRRTQNQGFTWIWPATGDYPAEGIRIQHKGASLCVLLFQFIPIIRINLTPEGTVDALTASYNGLRARADLIASLEQ